MAEVTLSINEFKALSSDTRVKIMKLLSERNHTLTELSKKLGLASPTIKQHLELLLQSELVLQNDEGRKWKYYALTRKGKHILFPQETNVMILLATAGIGLMVTVFLLSGVLLSSTGASFSATSPGAYNETFNQQDLVLGSGETAREEMDSSGKAVAPQDSYYEGTQGTEGQEKETILFYSGIDFMQAGILLALALVFAVLLGVGAEKLRKSGNSLKTA